MEEIKNMTDAELVEAVKAKWPGSKFAENVSRDLLNGVNQKVCRETLEAALMAGSQKTAERI